MNNLNNEELKSEAEAQLEKAKNFNKRGEKAEALAAYQAAAQIFERLEDERGQARAFSGMGKVYGKHKDFGRAVEAFGIAAQHSNRANWSDKEIEARYNQGLTLQQMGLKAGNLAQVKQAIQSFEQGLAVARQINDRASQGVLLISLGFACAWAKDNEPAIAYFREAATFALDNLDFDTAFSALSSLGVLLSDSNRADEAIPYYQRALELAKSEQGDIVAVADTFANLGIAYEKAGQLEEALDSLENYHEILKHAGDVKASDAAAMVKRLKQKLKLQIKK
jgi:tetratricopeptide (TPR) repeat protein